MSSAALGLGPFDIFRIQLALANPAAPKVIWLQGSGCSGCSISFLNRIADTTRTTAAAVLADTVDLIYHPALMSASGSEAVSIVQDAVAAGGHILVVEGGVPTAFGGAACWPWSNADGKEVTFADAVKAAAAKATQVICVGACASFGGVSAAGENPGGVESVSTAIGRSTVNVSGCPPHPDWIIAALAQVIVGGAIDLDVSSRPMAIYGKKVHDECPRNTDKDASLKKATQYGVDNLCMLSLGCRGPSAMAPCPSMKWNNGANWCVDANANCLGCTEPTFPAADFHVTV